MTWYQKENCSSREHGLCHLDTQTWSALIRPHLKGKRSLILKVGDPLGLEGAESRPLDQSTQHKHPFLAVSGPSDLQTVWQRRPDARGQRVGRMLHTNYSTFLFFEILFRLNGDWQLWRDDHKVIHESRAIKVTRNPNQNHDQLMNQWLTGPGWGRKSPGRSPGVPVLDTPSHGTDHSPHTLRHRHTSTVTNSELPHSHNTTRAGFILTDVLIRRLFSHHVKLRGHMVNYCLVMAIYCNSNSTADQCSKQHPTECICIMWCDTFRRVWFELQK